MDNFVISLKDIDPYLSLDSNGEYEPTINDFLDLTSDCIKHESKLSTVIDAEGATIFIAPEEIARWLCKLANEYFNKVEK